VATVLVEVTRIFSKSNKTTTHLIVSSN